MLTLLDSRSQILPTRLPNDSPLMSHDLIPYQVWFALNMASRLERYDTARFAFLSSCMSLGLFYYSSLSLFHGSWMERWVLIPATLLLYCFISYIYPWLSWNEYHDVWLDGNCSNTIHIYMRFNQAPSCTVINTQIHGIEKEALIFQDQPRQKHDR